MRTAQFLLLTVALAGTALLGVAQAINPPEAYPTCADGELLVKWRGGPLSTAAAVGNARCGGQVKRDFCDCGWQWVKLPPGMTVSRALELYRGESEVLAAEPNMAAHLNATPNDTQFGSQWNLQKISAPAAWDITKGSTNVVVAVIDTGVEYTHPDLSANMWRNPGEIPGNGVDDDGNGYVDDIFGLNSWEHNSDPMDLGAYSEPGSYIGSHGTVVAGFVGAVGNNGMGIAGVNWSVQIMAVRFVGGIYTEERPGAWVTGILEGYEYVIAMKRRGTNIRAINASTGFYTYSQALADAVEAAGNEGILSSCAAGNAAYNTDISSQFPSCYDSPYVISVAATDSSDQLASFSNFGRSTVDLAAPGDNLMSTTRTNTYGSGASGTSFAAPHVTGAVALLAAARPTATWREIKTAILQSVDPIPALTNRVATGGRLNLARALQVLTNSSLPPVVLGAFPGHALTRTDAPIEVYFNQPMDRASVEAALLVTPPISGNFSWSDDDRVCRLTPNTPFLHTNYSARILGTATSAAGSTLDGNFNRLAQGVSADDFVWGFQLALPNDYFANALIITGNTGSLAATSLGASYEVDEPDHAGSYYMVASVWYRWTPETNGWVTFNILSNSFDSLLAAYTGNRLDALTPVAASDNDGLKTGGRFSFNAEAGVPYFIAVAGKSANTGRFGVTDSSMGRFTLSWFPTSPAALSSFTPISGYIGSTVTLTGLNFTGATGVLFNGVSAIFTNAPTNNADFGITTSVPPGATTGPITVVTPHGNSTLTNAFTLLAAPALGLRMLPGNQVELSWPVTGAAGFFPEAGDSVPSPIWSRVSAAVVTTNGLRTMKLPASAASKFYRMRKL